MSPGVGKTYAMLDAACRELAAGRDVVIGYVDTHGRKETDAGLPQMHIVAPQPPNCSLARWNAATPGCFASNA